PPQSAPELPAPAPAPALRVRTVVVQPVADVLPLRGDADRRMPTTRVRARPATGTARSRLQLPATPVALLAVALLALVGLRKAARIIGRRVDEQTLDPGGAGVALRGGSPAPWPRGRIRSAGGRLRPVSPFAWERRADGQRDRRARDADHGRRGRGGEVIR